MTPLTETFTISKELTGYTEDQTITPNELAVWRVLQINSDGTIDMISEYTSSNRIYFKGETGYKNYIGVLNMIASAYTNSDYTIGSRYPGYNGQTEFLTVDLDKSKIGDHSTGWNGVNNEPYGGGDMWFAVDVNLIRNILQTMFAYSVNSEDKNGMYWIAGRYYWCNSSTTSCNFYMRFINTVGTADNGRTVNGSASDFIRPIITLKTGLTPSQGDGTSESPWTFN